MSSMSVIVLMYIYLCILLGGIPVSLASPSSGTVSGSSASVSKDEISLSGGSASNSTKKD